MNDNASLLRLARRLLEKPFHASTNEVLELAHFAKSAMEGGCTCGHANASDPARHSAGYQPGMAYEIEPGTERKPVFINRADGQLTGSLAQETRKEMPRPEPRAPGGLVQVSLDALRAMVREEVWSAIKRQQSDAEPWNAPRPRT